jgi:cellulase (glycosyl hydrolase family 5)
MVRRVALGLVTAAAMVTAASALSADSTVTSTPCGPVRADRQARASLHVAGTRMQDTNGNVVLPYGISLVSGPQTVNWAQTEKAAAAQIIAAHRYWHANTIRVQVSEALLLDNPTRGHSYNVPFARSVDRLVCRILRQGDIPVMNDTTIFTGRERGPGQRTIRFWRFMSSRFGNRFPVIFDLFNEPQVTKNRHTGRFLSPSHAWRVWRSGGRVDGIRYVGMQDLVDEIRIRQRVSNVIWAEEPYYLEADQARLDLLPRYQLKGADIVYAFHKPNMRASSRSFTDLRAAAAQQIPLIDSEWGQFAATDRPWMCQHDAAQTAPAYLQFLRDSSIGVLAWSLQPGALVKGIAGRDTVHDGKDMRFTANPRALALPNRMNHTYGCTDAARGQGVGRLLMDYFARYSAHPEASLFPRFG